MIGILVWPKTVDPDGEMLSVDGDMLDRRNLTISEDALNDGPPVRVVALDCGRLLFTV